MTLTSANGCASTWKSPFVPFFGSETAALLKNYIFWNTVVALTFDRNRAGIDSWIGSMIANDYFGLGGSWKSRMIRKCVKGFVISLPKLASGFPFWIRRAPLFLVVKIAVSFCSAVAVWSIWSTCDWFSSGMLAYWPKVSKICHLELSLRTWD